MCTVPAKKHEFLIYLTRIVKEKTIHVLDTTNVTRVSSYKFGTIDKYMEGDGGRSLKIIYNKHTYKTIFYL